MMGELQHTSWIHRLFNISQLHRACVSDKRIYPTKADEIQKKIQQRKVKTRANKELANAIKRTRSPRNAQKINSENLTLTTKDNTRICTDRHGISSNTIAYRLCYQETNIPYKRGMRNDAIKKEPEIQLTSNEEGGYSSRYRSPRHMLVLLACVSKKKKRNISRKPVLRPK